MHKEVNITGKRYGKLIAIKRTIDYVAKSGLKIPQWIFKCDCGKEKAIKKHKVISERTISCGCTRKFYSDRTRPNFNSLYNSYKKGARYRGLDFNLSPEYFEFLTKENCYYCGQKPESIKNSEAGNAYIYNGLDRINSKIGYNTENVVTCCKQCNYSKLDYNYEEFINMIKKIYNHLKLGEDQ